MKLDTLTEAKYSQKLLENWILKDFVKIEKNLIKLMLQASRSLCTVIYASERVHHYPRTIPETIESSDNAYFGYTRVQLATLA